MAESRRHRDGDEAHADAVERLLHDRALAAEMGEQGRLLVMERLHAERELQPYVALCRRLLGHDDGR